MSHGWANVRPTAMAGRYSSEIRTGCANQRPSGSVRGAASNPVPTAINSNRRIQDLLLSYAPAPPVRANGSSIQAKGWVLVFALRREHSKLRSWDSNGRLSPLSYRVTPPGQKCEQSSSDGGRANPLMFSQACWRAASQV